MKDRKLRIGFIGAGANTRKMHIPGFQKLENVELSVVANRSLESARNVAKRDGIKRVAENWQEVVQDNEVDAVCIGTWPYLHAEATIAALENGKHVLCEARMASDLEEAKRMKAVSEAHPDLVAQIVPAPFSLDFDSTIREMICKGKLGELLEVRVVHTGGQAASPDAPMSWRQDLNYSGKNILSMGILHETVERWLEDEPAWLIADGAIFQSTSDTEVILHLLSRSKRGGIVERFIDALRQIEGAYGLVGLTGEMMIGARDPVGIRPLVLGRVDGCYVLASETCALDMVGAEFVREVENGEVVVITKDGLESHRPFPPRPAQPCMFEYIYFARPDSVVGGQSVYEIRKQMGVQLALEAPAQADVIVPIPDSGVPAAIGFSQQSGIPFEMGIVRNHYVGRTFIEPEQRIRALGVKLKHSANAHVVRGKHIVLIDDSVVRGTTSRKLVNLMYEAGALSVHMRIASPPIAHPDYYGIDTPSTTELLAANHDLEAMRELMGADTLAFLTIAGIYRAIGVDERNNAQPQFTDHCFTGEYPTNLTDRCAKQGEPDNQLSLLAEVI